MRKYIIEILFVSAIALCVFGIFLSFNQYNSQKREILEQIYKSDYNYQKQKIIQEFIETQKTLIYQEVERAYFEGQRDALTNDIRIQKNQDGRWMWIKSPWDCGKKPIFDPSTITDKPIKVK